MRAEEIDYLMGIDVGGIKTYSNGDVYHNQILEWFDTPVGKVWGKPSWGNTLNQYKHFPHSASTAAAIENSIMIKMPRDLPSIPIKRIRVETIGADLYRIRIITKYTEEPLVKDMKL